MTRMLSLLVSIIHCSWHRNHAYRQRKVGGKQTQPAGALTLTPKLFFNFLVCYKLGNQDQGALCVYIS